MSEVDRLEPDVLLFGGDVAAGPFPHETIALLRGLDARFVMGNADRTLIDGRLGSMFDWATTQVTEDDKDFLRGFEQAIAIDDVLYCHSTPTSDEEWITILTPDDLAREILGEVGYPTLVQGHTHTQFDRMIGEHSCRQRRQRRDGQRRRARRPLAARRRRRAASTGALTTTSMQPPPACARASGRSSMSGCRSACSARSRRSRRRR